MSLTGAEGISDSMSACVAVTGDEVQLCLCQLLLTAAECKQQMAELAPEQHVNFKHSALSPAAGYSHYLSSRSIFIK